jgi:hypothetical protein
MLNTEPNANLSIKDIIANDIKKYSEEMNIPLRQLIKDFAKNTNIVLRTMENVLRTTKKFTPHVTTVVDIYSQIYNANSLAEIISKAHPMVSDFIKKNHMQFIGGAQNKYLDVSNHSSIQADLTSSSIFNQIYLMTAGDHGTDLARIREKFGSNGLKQLDEMIKLGFVEIDSDDQIKRKKRLTWDRKIRKNFIKTIIQDVYNEENSDLENPNYISVAIGDVTHAEYETIREKMKVNYLEIMDIVNNSKPTYEEAVRFTLAEVIEKSNSRLKEISYAKNIKCIAFNYSFN